MRNNTSPDQVVGWRVRDWSRQAGVGRTSTFNLIKAGTIAAVKHGAATVITTPPKDYLASLPKAG
jgi:hypothetical protein